MKKNHVVISRAHFLAMIFASFVVLFATSFLAYAYGTTVPTAFGHSGGEVNVNCPIGNPSLVDVNTCLSRMNAASGALPANVGKFYWCTHNGGYVPPGDPDGESGNACSNALPAASGDFSGKTRGYRVVGCTVTISGVKYLAGNIRQFNQQWWGDVGGWVVCDGNTVLVTKVPLSSG